MAVEQQAILNALQGVLDPNTGKDFVSTKALKNLQIAGSDVSFDVELGYPAKVVADPDGEVAGIYKAVARQVAITIAAKAKDFSAKFPTIKIAKDT